MKVQLDKGIFELENFTLEAVEALCNQYADAPEVDNPLSFLTQSREMTVAVCRNNIREMLRRLDPAVGYSLFPISDVEMGGKFIDFDGNLNIG